MAVRVSSWSWLGFVLASCAAQSAQVGMDTPGEDTSVESAGSAPEPAASEQAPGAAKSANGAPAADEGEPEPPALDPLLVQKAVDVSAEEPTDGRTRLGLRLAAVAQGPDEPWLLAVVNRGTEPARVLFDLRLLSLEVTPPAPPSDNPKKPPKPPKPVTCKLPANARPDIPKAEFEVVLAPGEGVVDSFDPRLYCFSKKEKGLLAGGAQVQAHLGFPEKTKTVWKKGKRETVVVEQTHPFVARRAAQVTELEKLGEEPARDPGPGAPSSDRDAVKELVAPPIEVAAQAAANEPPPGDPFELVATDGSDAATARQVTVAVSVVNRGKEPRHLYFRREGLSFQVSGPSGLVRCEPGPDARAPDRQSFSRIKPGGRVSAVSRLIELCPDGTFDDPGLYLIDASFASNRSGSSFGLSAYTGSFESRAPVAVRVQKGPRPYLPQHPPLIVRVGQPRP